MEGRTLEGPGRGGARPVEGPGGGADQLRNLEWEARPLEVPVMGTRPLE